MTTTGSNGYCDHLGLWGTELREWVPEEIFDAHVHLGPPGIAAKFSDSRRKHPLTTFSSLTVDELEHWYSKLFSGKKITGMFAFPFPVREVDFCSANVYIIELMRLDKRIRGFLWTNPLDTPLSMELFKCAELRDVRFTGIKPYFDLLGKSNFDCHPHEILPPGILEFAESEKLAIMLHTTGTGMADAENREFIGSLLDKYKNIRMILAHMGRFIRPKDFEVFFNSEIIDHPRIYLDISSVTDRGVYDLVLSRESLWERILFASDLPYGLITGVEYWSEENGALFLTRDRYLWSEPESCGKTDVTYNVYHVLKAMKDAITDLKLPGEREVFLKNLIFRENSEKFDIH